MHPFDLPGRFWRGNLHLHSTASDGHRTPEEVCNDYRIRGYDFVALTDHFKSSTREADPAKRDVRVTDTSAFRRDDFTTIFGAEVHGPGLENNELWHIVCAGLPLDFAEPGPDETGLEIVRRAREAGAWISLAHPHWNTLTDNDALNAADVIHAVEVYNHNCEVEVMRGWGMHYADVLLNRGHRVQLNAADDAHIQTPGPGFRDAFGGWVMVKAESLEPDALVSALKAGDYYSSTGPEIHHVAIEGDRIHVECSPAVQIVASGYGSASTFIYGASMVDEWLPMPWPTYTRYVRIMVMDIHGNRAWTNPFWLD